MPMEELKDVALARFTTLKVGGQARHVYQPTTSDELANVIDKLDNQDEPWAIIGGGSNLLISSRGVQSSVIRMTKLTGMETLEADLIDVGAGVRLPHLAKYAASAGLSGLEFAVGIPGTVGGGVVMNAGAHGSSMSEIVESVTMFDVKSRKMRILTNSEMDFVYRNSRVDPSQEVVVSARIRLIPAIKEEIEAKTKANEDYRWRTQPLNFPSAGSTFKNPAGNKAGLLLEQAGAKEFQVGQAAVSNLHANFVINLGGAVSQDVVSLLAKMQEAVYNANAIHLEPEWKILGDFTKEELSVWEAKEKACKSKS